MRYDIDHLRSELAGYEEDYARLERIALELMKVLEVSGHADFLLLTNPEVKEWWEYQLKDRAWIASVSENKG